MPFKFQSSLWLTALCFGRGVLAGAATRSPPALAQIQAHERGNCFHVVGCRGDSIGATIIDSPASCATLGGKSWVDPAGNCFSFSSGPQGQFLDNYSQKKVQRLPPRRY